MNTIFALQGVVIIGALCGATVAAWGEPVLEPVACALAHIGNVDTLGELREGMRLHLAEMNVTAPCRLPLEENPVFLTVTTRRTVRPGWSTAEACLRLDWTKEWMDGVTGKAEGVAIEGPCPIEGGWKEAFRIAEQPGDPSAAQ